MERSFCIKRRSIESKIEKDWGWKSNAEVYDNKLWRLLLKLEKKYKDDISESKQKYGSETMVYPKNLAEQESYFKQKELDLRK